MDETFFLSNMAPQVGDGFNRHKWNGKIFITSQF
jgi:DNA/RNA endonuclease G (NUC1)